MAEWSFPQITDDTVDMVVGDFSVDVTDVSSPDDVEVLDNAALYDGVHLTVSGGDVVGVSMSIDDFKEFVLESSSYPEEDAQVSENDIEIMPLAVDVSTSTFTPHTWQLNMAQNRPIGYHYVMSRLGTNNNQYVLVLGRDITYSNGVYIYQDCEYYSVYQTTVSSSTRYNYDVREDASGSINSSTYVCYSDLFFDYVGGRSVSYSWFILAFVFLGVLLLMYIRGKRK